MPCNCTPHVIVDPGNPTSTCKDCLKVASITLPCLGSIGPCNEEGTINLMEFNNYDVCTCGAVVHEVIGHGPELLAGSVTIDDDNVLHFTTDHDAAIQSLNKYVEIKYRAVCSCDTGIGTQLSGMGIVRICIKDRCMYQTCSDGTCNPCNGNCE